jgi:hypothetical protein
MASILHIGDSIFSRVDTSDNFTQFLKENLPGSDPLIIKADWVGMGHQLWRSRVLEPSGLKFTINDKEVDWDWLLEGKGWTWLIRQRADWSFFIDGPHWSHIIKEERAFLEKHGFIDFFNDNGIEYVNVTDEIWSGRIADPKIVKEIVESKYAPAFTEKLYGFVPEKLYRHRGSSLVSLSKRKDYQSFTMKNNFGLIPDPVRAWWHGFKKTNTDGPGGARLAKSVLDINKVYGALFDLVGVFEAPRGDWSTFTRDLGVSRDMAQLDAILNHLFGYDPKLADYISSGNGVFGAFNSEMLKEAELQLSGWFPIPRKAS